MKYIECPYCGQKQQLDNLMQSIGKTNIYICPDCKKEYLFFTLGMRVYCSKLDWVVEASRISNLYKLPSEHQEAVQKAIEKLEKTGELDIYEPCDCGNHIQHNNGGNYHQIYEIKKDNNAYFVKDDCTSELEPPATWEESTKEEVYQLIQDCADWL